MQIVYSYEVMNVVPKTITVQKFSNNTSNRVKISQAILHNTICKLQGHDECNPSSKIQRPHQNSLYCTEPYTLYPHLLNQDYVAHTTCEGV